MNGSTSTGAHTDTTGRGADPDATVVVVGAGPTGLLLAGDLAAAGVPVTVLEKRPAGISNLTRAFGVHARTLEQLDARGLADELVTTGRRIGELRLFDGLTIDLTGLRSRFPFLLSTPQYEVEKLLHRRAATHGVTFRHGTEVTGLRQDTAGVDVEVRHEDGATGTVRATYVVGADGVRSTVREATGQPFPGRPVLRSIILADVKLTDEPEFTVALNGANDAFAFLIPFGDGYWRVGGWNREHADVPDSAPASLDELKDVTRRAFGSDFGMYDARWLSRFHCDERQVASYRKGRVFLAGDAAHTHSPAGGQGMNTGLQDAANLSWKLASVLQGRAPLSLLDTYQSERHPVGRTVLRSSGALIRLATAHSSAQHAVRSRLAALLRRVPALRERVIGQITGIGYAYAAPRGAHPLTGRRAPDLALAAGPAGTRLHEALREGRFVLVTPTGLDLPEKDDAGRELHATTAHWMTGRRTSLLVRPDGYVAWAREEARPEEVRTALAAWTGAGRAGV